MLFYYNNNYDPLYDDILYLHRGLKFKEHVPDSMIFKVGYYEEKDRMWIVTADDIKPIYTQFKTREITLWCEGHTEDVYSGEKRKRDEQPSRY